MLCPGLQGFAVEIRPSVLRNPLRKHGLGVLPLLALRASIGTVVVPVGVSSDARGDPAEALHDLGLVVEVAPLDINPADPIAAGEDVAALGQGISSFDF